MSDKTHIEWTDATWNPVTGCSKVSKGCKHCYAERDWARLAAPRPTPNAYTGRHFTDVQCHHDRLDQPLRWAKPRRIFVNSMSDLFHEDVPDEFIADVFAYMCYARQHNFQVLTKRPARMAKLLSDPDWIAEAYDASLAIAHEDACEILGRRGEFSPYERKRGDIRAHDPALPLANVWLGVSVEDQATADERIPLLLQTPAAVRWISAEPLLGPLLLDGTDNHIEALAGWWRRLDWVVVGGESGANARPMHLDWARSLRDQCASAGIPFLFKQWGESTPAELCPNPAYPGDGSAWRLDQRGKHWHDAMESTLPPSEWAPVKFARVGKKAAGRLLDGVQHDGYPEARP